MYDNSNKRNWPVAPNQHFFIWLLCDLIVWFYIIAVSSTTVADREVVHHVATGVCEEPDSTEEVW